MKALISGITGQDGHHLTHLLLSKGYEVHGFVQNHRTKNEELFVRSFPLVFLHRGDLTLFDSVIDVIAMVKPSEIYNLGAKSFVGTSFQHPELTANVNGIGAIRIFEAIRKTGLENSTRIYQASSSEMFGKVKESPQTEFTSLHPRSPYGVAKAFAHLTAINYRETYGMHISSGILFNHEGEYRGHEYVTRKITSNVARIALGKQERFSLGDLSPRRDWGYAGEYVEAMWKMLQQDEPDDYVIATGKTHRVYDFVEMAIRAAGLKGSVEDYVDFDKEMIRPAEVDLLVGDPTKAKTKLGWEAKVDLQGLVDIMIKNDLVLEAK